MKVEWNESICLGVPRIDEDHKRLIQILNFIEAHQDDDVRTEAISTVIEQIREFTSNHFRYEEEYMLRINYPDYEAHKEQHKIFKGKIAALCIDVMNHKKNTPKEIYHQLSEWVVNHLLRTDKQIQAFTEARQACNETDVRQTYNEKA